MLARTKVETVIGKGFADALDEAVFEVTPKFSYTRRQMVEDLGCANFIAAGRLAKVLKRLGIDSPAQLNRLDPVSLARTKGIGAACIFVAMCILDAAQYNVLDWWKYDEESSVKFSTFKHHAMRRATKRKQEVA